MKKYFRFTVTVGLSRPVRKLNEIRSAYRESVIALQNKLVAGSGKIIDFGSLNESSKGAGFLSFKWNEQVLSALRRNDFEKIVHSLAQMKEYIKASILPVDYTYAILMSLVSLCLSHITEAGGDIGQILGEDFRPYQQLRKIESLDESFEWLSRIFEKTVSHYRDQKMTRAQKIVRDVQEYIEKHFADSGLTVESIARHFHLDSSYIRKMFSREQGGSVAEYITHVRLNQAKRLMETSDMKLQELSERVGYSDAGYFSKVFKKHFDMLPSEYMGR